MTDILCPVCGKANPPDAETCRYCQAPLKTSAFIPNFDEGSDLPDWLRNLNADQTAFPMSGTDDEASTGSESLINVEEETKGKPPFETPIEHAEENPDWLTDLIRDETVEPMAADLPDWLEKQATPPTTPLPSEENEEPGKMTGPSGEEEPPSGIQAFTYDTLEELEKQKSSNMPEGEVESGGELLTTLPDWVASVTAEETEVKEDEGEGNLAPAQLPSWLEAMRPVEVEQPSIPPEDLSSLPAESSGPLIGLRGVLSGEGVSIRPRKAHAYAIKLRVTDEQKQRVALLEQLLADEPKPKALPAAPVISGQNIFRLVIALALLLPILWAVVSKGQLTPLPDPATTPGVVAMYNLIERLPAGGSVLVAFDYEVGYSGEMDAAAFSIFERLLDRSAYMTFVSTSPTGPALAERFIANLNQQPWRINEPFTNYANLGYIPGGTIGLHSLTRTLQGTLPYDLNGVDVWASGSLSNVKDLTDFSLVLVLVSDPETARAWVEQVGPTLKQGGTPLAMIASAQTAPLVMPYFAGNPLQIEALVAGMVGGATFENLSATSGPARQAWDPYSLGMVVTVLVILVGMSVDMSYKALAGGIKDK